MSLFKQSSELLAERRILLGPDNKSIDNDPAQRPTRRRKLGRFSGARLLFWVFSSATFVSIFLALFGLKIILHGNVLSSSILLDYHMLYMFYVRNLDMDLQLFLIFFIT